MLFRSAVAAILMAILVRFGGRGMRPVHRASTRKCRDLRRSLPRAAGRTGVTAPQPAPMLAPRPACTCQACVDLRESRDLDRRAVRQTQQSEKPEEAIVNKADLVQEVQKQLGAECSKAHAERAVNALIASIQKGLKKDKIGRAHV